MSECGFRWHQWDEVQEEHPRYNKVGITCEVCGVGYTFEMTRMPNKAIRVDTTIFPARFQTKISREVVRFFVTVCESTVDEMEQAGETVIRGGTRILAEPVGI